MRVLMWLDEGSSTIPGGHLTQLQNTASALQNLGITVDLQVGPAQDLSPYDLVHGFTLDRQHIRRCRDRHLPVAISTVYWGRWPPASGRGSLAGLVVAARSRARMAGLLAVRALQSRHNHAAARIVAPTVEQAMQFEAADLLLPNSNAELDAIRADLRVTTSAAVVPNGVDTGLFRPPEGNVRREGVVCAARIEPHKNQLALIRAMRRTDIPVVIVGPQHPHHPRYYEACQRAAGANVSLRPAASPAELAELFARSRVHVLPSWSETTGLVSLEAAATGCNIVTTDRGYAREYFAEDAWYCSPDSVPSIRRAVVSAHRAPLSDQLQERVAYKYTWGRAAEATAAAYAQLLSR